MTAITTHGVPVAKLSTGRGKSAQPGKASRRRLRKITKRKAATS